MKKASFFVASAMLAFAAGSVSAGPAAVAAAAAAPKADKNLIQAHLSFLADDLLEGRGTGTRGFDLAANYVAAQFTQYGVAPKGVNGYFQPVKFRSAQIDTKSPAFELSTSGGKETLAFGSDFLMFAGLLNAKDELSAPLVFAGYGVSSERFKYDDYAGLDVKGKIVVMMFGRPGFMPSEEGAHFANMDVKRMEALKRGAVGIITLATPTSETVYPFNVIKGYLALPRMTWVDKNGAPAHESAELQSGALLSIEGAQKLFAKANVKFDALLAAAKTLKAGQSLPRIEFNASAHLSRATSLGEALSNNVVGVVEGSDPVLKNEYVVYSAHLDHLGVNKEKSGDNIYNGAMDNASGVSTLIEMARLVSSMPVKPKRSMIFIALTGEEKGLLGSDAFANAPTVPLKDIVASVNLDMPILTYDFSNVVAFGAEHSSLKGTIARAAKKGGIALIPDPWPEQNLFVRSDHYNFVRQGVPSVYLVTGTTSFDKKEDVKAIHDDFMKNHYHKPNDDLNQPINWEAAARFAQVNYLIGVEIANDKNRPSWNKGDFFGDTFRKN